MVVRAGNRYLTRFFQFVIVLSAAALSLFLLFRPDTFYHPGDNAAVKILALCALAVLLQFAITPSLRDEMGLDFVTVFPAFILLGTAPAIIVGLVGAVAGEILGRRAIKRAVPAVAGVVLAVGGGGLLYYFLGGTSTPLAGDNWFALSFYSPVYYAVTRVLERVFLVIIKDEPFWPPLSQAKLDVAAHLILTAYGLLLAVAYLIQGLFAATLILASLVAVIYLMRLQSRLQSTNRELKMLYETSRKLSGTLRVDRIFEITAGAVAGLVAPEAVCLFMVNKPGGRMDLEAVSEIQDSPFSNEALAALSRTVGELAVTREPVVISDRQFSGEGDSLPCRSLMVLPLRSEDNLIGAMVALHREPRRFFADGLRILSILSSQISAAIESAMFHEKTENLAVTDPMTGLYNYRYFYLKLEEEVRKARARNNQLALIYIDIDKFKHYNDTFGHLVGDGILCHFADILRQSIRYTDIPARYAGDEFVVILPGSSRHESWEVTERIHEAVTSRPFRIPDKNLTLRIQFSAGVACFPYDALTVDELIYRADKAMYGQKQENGKGVL